MPNMEKPKRIGRKRTHDYKKIYELHLEGKSYKEIQSLTGATGCTINMAIKMCRAGYD